MTLRVKHLKRMMRVFGDLKIHPNGALSVNVTVQSKVKPIQGQNWIETCPNAKEDMPPDMTNPLDRSAKITCFVDADHALDQLTRRSVTKILLFINNSPNREISKHQKAVETSNHGSQLVAAKEATVFITEMCCNLCTLGAPSNGLSLLFGDNQSVVLKTTVPFSIFKKKHKAAAYHSMHESIAAGVLVFAPINGEDNHADSATKSLGKATFYRLACKVLFRQPDATGCEERTTPVI